MKKKAMENILIKGNNFPQHHILRVQPGCRRAGMLKYK